MTLQLDGICSPRTPLRVAEISEGALHHNIAAVRRSGARVIVVVKADAYGHGAAIVAPAAIAAGADTVAVASLDEALALRDSGFTGQLLCWLHGEDLDVGAALGSGVQLGLSTAAQLRALGSAARAAGTRGEVHLKLDTGLRRNGAAPSSWDELFTTAAAAQRAGVIRIVGVFSHLANAGPTEDRTQAARFDAGVRRLQALGIHPPLRHLAASAAAATSPHLRYDAVRVGLTAYGLSPDPAQTSAQLGLRPVMTLSSQIIALRSVPAGTGISYGFTHVCAEESTLALVPIGYADGMPRALNGSGASVSVRGERAPIVGRIGMDQCIIDVTRLTGRVRVGERVVLFGDPARGHPAVEEWAERLDTINYEVVARIGARVQRVATDPVEVAR